MMEVMQGVPTVFVVDDDAAPANRSSLWSGERDVNARGLRLRRGVSGQVRSHAHKGCLVVDVRMAGMSGLELLQELKARKMSLPVVVITGYADVPMAVRAMQAGAVTFLEKPCQDQELWQAIQQALEIEQTQHAQRKQRAEIEARLAIADATTS